MSGSSFSISMPRSSDAGSARLPVRRGVRRCPARARAGRPATAAIHLRIAYTSQRPALELIEAVPGTPWSPDRAGLHHLGYHVDDLGARANDRRAVPDRDLRPRRRGQRADRLHVPHRRPLPGRAARAPLILCVRAASRCRRRRRCSDRSPTRRRRSAGTSTIAAMSSGRAEAIRTRDGAGSARSAGPAIISALGTRPGETAFARTPVGTEPRARRGARPHPSRPWPRHRRPAPARRGTRRPTSCRRYRHHRVRRAAGSRSAPRARSRAGRRRGGDARRRAEPSSGRARRRRRQPTVSIALKCTPSIPPNSDTARSINRRAESSSAAS